MIAFRVSKLTDLVVDVSLTSVARGDVLYRGASKWNNLAAGTAGHVLTSGGAGADPSWAAITAAPFDDASAIVKGSSDATKLLRFEVDGFTTGTTRVMTPPNADTTIAGLEVTQTWTAQQTFETGAAGASPTIFRQTGGTPGTHQLEVSHNGTNPIIESKSGGIRVIPPSASNYFAVQAGNNAGTQYSVRLFHDAGGSSYLDSQNSHMTMRQPVGSYTRFGNTNGYIGLNVISPDGHNGGTIFSTPYTPSQITSDQHNYAPGVARNYRLSSDASRDITGLSASQVDGQECYFINVGAQNIVLKHDVTSTAANRFCCAGSADITLAPNDIARLVYDATSARWRVGEL